MRIIDQVKALPALERLAEKEMSYGDAYDLWQVLAKVRGNAGFFFEKERQLLEKYGVKEDGEVKIDEQGRFKVTDAGLYKTDHAALEDIEVDDVKICLCRPETISAEDLANLDALVEWRADD